MQLQGDCFGLLEEERLVDMSRDKRYNDTDEEYKELMSFRENYDIGHFSDICLINNISIDVKVERQYLREYDEPFLPHQ